MNSKIAGGGVLSLNNGSSFCDSYTNRFVRNNRLWFRLWCKTQEQVHVGRHPHMQIQMHFLYNKPSSSSSSPYMCWVFLRRAAPGCSSKCRDSPPGRPHRFHKPSPAQTPPGKSVMALGQLTKGASWEELIQACLQSFGKSCSPASPL